MRPSGIGSACPVRRAAIDEAGPLLPKFGLGPLGDTQGMLAQRGGVGAGRDRQDVGEQTGRGGVGHERRPACLQIEPLRGDMIGDQVAQRRHGRWTAPCLGTGSDAAVGWRASHRHRA